ncbi:MAG: hypothetical protein D3925_02680 [Candidatus Electrothrix sp. AR5]|nr:hypothetical protein [Candidatus Electrothrix sp. AR5]
MVAGLDSDKSQPVTGPEIDAELSALREQFKMDALPVHPDIKSAAPDVSPFSKWTFVKQLQLIKIGERRIQRASKNFYQASEQRSRWVREDLLIDNELNEYDELLTEEWAIRFDQSIDSMASDANDANRIASGQKLYNWTEIETNFPIRSSCPERFITRGSFHILANHLQVGWHPDFHSLLDKNAEEETS